MAFKGTLDTLGTIDVLQLIAMTRKSGRLAVEHPAGDAKSIYFDAGDVVTATSSSAKDRLGEILVKTGVLDRAKVEAARSAERKTGLKQGQALLAAGHLDEAKLNLALARQIAEIFYSVMVWREGSFEFFEGELPGPDVFRVRESLTNLIMEGTRQLDEWSLIEKVFPSLDVVLSLSPPKHGGGDIRLQPDEWQVLTMIDGQRSVREICALASFSDFEVCKKLLNLHHVGLIAVGPPKRAATPLPPPPAPRAAAPLPRPPLPPPPSATVPPGFAELVRMELTKLVGPIAAIILDEARDSLGSPLEALPAERVAELARILCAEIDAPDRREQFRAQLHLAAGRA